MKDYNIIGIDLAKRKFHILALDSQGKTALKKKLKRDEVLPYIEKTFLKGSRIAMEACGGCHHWGRSLKELGYEVILLKPKDVKPFAKSRQKNDMNDALGICKAANDPQLKHVHLKSKKEQEIAGLHKTRKQIIKRRIQLSNSIEACLLEWDYLVNVSKNTFLAETSSIIKDAYNKSKIIDITYEQLLFDAEELKLLLDREKQINQKIKLLNKESEKAQKLLDIPGVGELIANILSVQPMESYEDARDYAASLGLVPSQHTSADKIKLGGISKQGNRYIRTMLIQGARTIIMRASRPNPPKHDIYDFAVKIRARKGFNLSSVAVANKIARIAYACVVKNTEYVKNKKEQQKCLIGQASLQH